ncbi:hypothetical protein HPB49_008746 [Dermacentor silvarum]|uniref:Uncharacterized protein n=1 Tax=Dermacentor silvarum TaxID=543639 RepID=A0ACB8DC02_DERSI|nr:hypothetical protein HPB49_008746 [Dermacentor silvarum]
MTQVDILLSLCVATTVRAGYPVHSGFVLPRIHGTIGPRILPVTPLGLSAATTSTDTLPPPNLAAGTFHGVPPVLEKYPLPSYPLAPPSAETHAGGISPVVFPRPPIGPVSHYPVRAVHSAFGPLPSFPVKSGPPAPTVGGAIVGGRPAVRAFVPQIPVITKVATPVLVPGSNSEPVYPPHPYEFGYDIVDEFGNTQYRHETSDAHNNKRGSYGYTDANGISRRVDYVADANGFRAHIRTNEPGTASSAPAGAVYDSKPVAVSTGIIKSQRGDLLLKAGGHDGKSNAGRVLFVSPVKPHPAIVSPTVPYLGGASGGHRTVIAPARVVLGGRFTRLHGPPTTVVNSASPVVVGGRTTLVGADVSGGPQDAAGVVATKVLTAPAATDENGAHATLGVVALQGNYHHLVAGHDYKAKSR